MPRDPSGNYSLPALGNPAVTNTPITIAWWNGTSTDMASTLTDSLSRSGLGGMLVPFKLVDGTSAAPAFSFQSETNTGFYLNAPGDLEVVVGGTRLTRWNAANGFASSPDNGSTWKFPVYGDIAGQSMGTTGSLDFGVGKLTINSVAVRTTTAATITSSSGAYTTSSTSFTTVTNLTTSFTSTGGRLVIVLQPDGTGSSALINNTGTIGTLKLTDGTNNFLFDVTSAVAYFAPGAFMAVTPLLSAGAHTVRCQVLTQVAQTFSVTNCTLAVYEI